MRSRELEGVKISADTNRFASWIAASALNNSASGSCTLPLCSIILHPLSLFVLRIMFHVSRITHLAVVVGACLEGERARDARATEPDDAAAPG